MILQHRLISKFTGLSPRAHFCILLHRGATKAHLVARRCIPRHSAAAAQQQAEQPMEHPQHASLGGDPSQDPDKPTYHVAPREGWANDGNGFIFYEGRYHM